MTDKYFYCVPIGETVRALFYKKLKQVPYHEGLMVLPNRNLVSLAQKDGLVNAGVWDNLLNVILDLADENSLVKINADVANIILKDIVKAEKDLPYFSQIKQAGEKTSLADKPGLIEGIYGLYTESQRKGVSLAQLDQYDKETFVGDIRATRGQEVKELIDLYEAKCSKADRELVDLEGRYKKACLILQDKALTQKLNFKVIAFSDLYEFTAPQLQIIDLLKNNLGVKVYISLPYELGARENLYAINAKNYLALKKLFGGAEFCNYSNDAGDLNELRKTFNVKVSDKKIVAEATRTIKENQNIHLYSFLNRDEEMRWVLSEVKSKLNAKVSPQDIVIATRSLDNYAGLRNIADEYGINLNRAKTTLLSSQPITQFTLDFVRAFQNTAEGAFAYFRLMNCPVARGNAAEIPADVLTMPSERYFTSRKQAQNAVKKYYENNKLIRNNFLYKVDSLIEQYDEGKVKVFTEYIALVNGILDFVADRKALGQLYASGQIDISELKLAILAKDTITNLLNSKCDNYKLLNKDSKLTLSDFRKIVEDSIAGQSIVVESAKKNGVRFCSVVELTGQKIPYVFLLGNREDEFPAPAKRRWLYTEQDRALLKEKGIELLNKQSDYDYDVLFFAQTIACATQELFLTWFRDIGVTDANAGCSVFVDYVKQYFDNVDYLAMRHIDVSSSRELAIAGRNPDADKRDYPFQGVNLDEAHGQAVWKKIVARKFSASALGCYKKCPLRYLAEKVWKAKNKQALDDAPNVAHQGTLIHDVLETFIKDHIIPSGTAISSGDYENMWAILKDVFENKCQEYEEKGYFGGPLWDVTKNENRILLERWLKYEYGLKGEQAEYIPCATEWKFGYDEDKGYQLEIEKCYSEETQDQLTASFCGTVDRFDKKANGDISILDYKTGYAPGMDDIQVPLYILAVDMLYKEILGDNLTVKAGAYLELKGLPNRKTDIQIPFGLTEKGNYSYAKSTKIKSYEECLEHFKKLLVDLLNGIHQGKFALDSHKLTSKSCNYCPLEPYCNAGKDDDNNEQ